MNIIFNASDFWILNWYYIAAVTLSAIGVTFGIKNYFKKGKDSNSPPPLTEINNQPTISPVNTLNVNINQTHVKDVETVPTEKVTDQFLSEHRIEQLKSRVKILFIDDDKKFNVVKILKDSGWKNATAVTDIKGIDIPIVNETDIFFIDINGVGKLLNCEYEGLDLALMIKQKYPNKKVVIYSANKNNNAFHAAWDLCDFKLEKNALPYQFQNLVEKYSLELR